MIIRCTVVTQFGNLLLAIIPLTGIFSVHSIKGVISLFKQGFKWCGVQSGSIKQNDRQWVQQVAIGCFSQLHDLGAVNCLQNPA